MKQRVSQPQIHSPRLRTSARFVLTGRRLWFAIGRHAPGRRGYFARWAVKKCGDVVHWDLIVDGMGWRMKPCVNQSQKHSPCLPVLTM